MAGLTTGGFVAKRLAEIRAELAERLASAFGISAEVRDDPNSIVGKLAGVLAAPLALVWQGLQAVHDAFNAETATGAQLDNLCALTGVYREPATFAFVPLTMTGTPGSTHPAGKLARSSASGVVFVLTSTTTIGGSGSEVATFRAEEPGAVFEAIGAIDEIATPSAGWSSVTNAAEASGGSDAEDDETLRARRRVSASIVGSATDHAIEAKILALSGVAQSRVISNRSWEVVDGRAPKSFEAVVWPSAGVPPMAEEDAAETVGVIYANAPCGIESIGTEGFTVVDSTGREQAVAFSYATAVDVYADITIGFGDNYAGDAAVEAAFIEAMGTSGRIGADVFTVDAICALASIAGVRSVVVTVGRTASPAEAVRLAIGAVEIPLFSAARINVTSAAI